MIKAFFLDRDGVLNDDSIAYVKKADDVNVYPWVPEAIKMISNAGYKIFIITNQPGIERGILTEAEVNFVHSCIDDVLRAHNAPAPDKWFCCPHEPYSNCSCHKPAPGMLLQAQKEFNINMAGSFVIGDRLTDILAGVAAGIPCGVHILSGYGINQKDEPLPENYLRADNLLDAVKLLINRNSYSK